MAIPRRLVVAFSTLLGTAALATQAQADPLLVNQITVPGDATDLAPGSSANENRLSLFSDLYFDRVNNLYYGIPDRGPGGGVIPFETRVEKFTLSVDPTSGAISSLNVIETVFLTDGTGAHFNGLNPLDLNGDKAVLGLSLDPEGIVVGANGHMFIADEYGPSVYEFGTDGALLRAFTPPENLLPREGDTDLNFFDGRPTIVNGRQDNRGFEGLTISPDGTKLYAILQDPLVNEGTDSGTPDGRRSRNLRIVEYDVATGLSTRQFIYQLEDRADINARIPGTADDFAASAQGRNIGASGIIAINDHEFLVIERDNRGVGVDNPTGNVPVGSKRVYKIDLNANGGATDVTNTSLHNTNILPGGVTPVGKVLFLDIQAALVNAGLPIPEKIEGLAIGPQLADGTYAILIGTDNDFSVTQQAGNVQFDVCVNATSSVQVPIGTPCPPGTALIPSRLLSFKGEVPGFQPQQVQPVPEPATMTLLGAGLLAIATRVRRRNR